MSKLISRLAIFSIAIGFVVISSSFESDIVRNKNGDGWEVRHYIEVMSWDLWAYHVEPMSKNEHAKKQIEEGKLNGGELIYEVVDGKIQWDTATKLSDN